MASEYEFREVIMEVEQKKLEALLRIAEALERLSPPPQNADFPQKLGFLQQSLFD